MRARGRLEHAGHDLDQRRFAGAVVADQARRSRSGRWRGRCRAAPGRRRSLLDALEPDDVGVAAAIGHALPCFQLRRHHAPASSRPQAARHRPSRRTLSSWAAGWTGKVARRRVRVVAAVGAATGQTRYDGNFRWLVVGRAEEYRDRSVKLGQELLDMNGNRQFNWLISSIIVVAFATSAAAQFPTSEVPKFAPEYIAKAKTAAPASIVNGATIVMMQETWRPKVCKPARMASPVWWAPMARRCARTPMPWNGASRLAARRRHPTRPASST